MDAIANRKIMLYDIYAYMMQESVKPITMDTLCSYIKCSKKSLYKNFRSKDEMLLEVYRLYNSNLRELLKDISSFESTPSQKLVFQIRNIHESGKILFKSYLFDHSQKIDEFKVMMRETERTTIALSLDMTVDEMDLEEYQKRSIRRLVAFICLSIKNRYMNAQIVDNTSDAEFLDMMITILLSHLYKEGVKNTKESVLKANDRKSENE